MKRLKTALKVIIVIACLTQIISLWIKGDTATALTTALLMAIFIEVYDES